MREFVPIIVNKLKYRKRRKNEIQKYSINSDREKKKIFLIMCQC